MTFAGAPSQQDDASELSETIHKVMPRKRFDNAWQCQASCSICYCLPLAGFATNRFQAGPTSADFAITP